MRNVLAPGQSGRNKKISAIAAGLDPVERTVDQLGCVIDLELLLHVSAVRFNCLNAEFQTIGNLAGRVAPSDEFEYFEFAIAETFDAEFLGFDLIAVYEFTQHPGRYTPPSRTLRMAVMTVSAGSCFMT